MTFLKQMKKNLQNWIIIVLHWHKDEFDDWLLVPEIRQVNATSPIDPLAWWKLHDSRFPRISKLARKYSTWQSGVWPA